MISIPPSPPPVQDLATLVATFDLFKGLTVNTLHAISTELEWLVFSDRQLLFSHGDQGDSLYLVIQGALESLIVFECGQEVFASEVGPGKTVGEMAFMTGAVREGSARARGRVEVVRLSRVAFDRIAAKHPVILERMSQIIVQRMRRNSLVFHLPKLFGQLDEATLRDIESKIEWLHLPPGASLMQQGEASDSFYLLIRGRLCAVVPNDDGIEQVVEEIHPGESVGEMGVLTGEKRTATVYAAHEAEVIKFSEAHFQHLLEQHPRFARYMCQLVARRLHRKLQPSPPSHSFTNIVLVPAGPDVPMAAFAQRLSSALNALGPTLHLNHTLLATRLGFERDDALDEGTPQRIWAHSWLDAQESKHRFVLYETDTTCSPWTHLCLKRADQILVVGRAAGDPTPGEIEAELYRQGDRSLSAKRVLVLLHPDGSRNPSGTQRWLAQRTVEMHHHIRCDGNHDFARLARAIAGKSIGVALSGGGARGLAHVGALQALLEAGIPIDMIGGTSMGACIAGQYALGRDLTTIVQATKNIFRTTSYDFTIPLASFLAGRKMVERLKTAIGEVQIEDLWLPYFCVSSNLTRASLMIHRSGPLWRGIRASGSLPGLLPPVVWDGDLLVDGAMLNNLPTDIMRQFCRHGTVFAVDVSPPVDLTNNTLYGDSLSGWQILLSRIMPWAQPITLPNIATIMNRAGQLSTIAQRKELIDGVADLYLPIPVEAYGLLEFGAADKLVALGYDYTREHLRAWRAAQDASPITAAFMA